MKENTQAEVYVKMAPVTQKLVRKYRYFGEDLMWVQLGVVATVVNGEAIPMVQKRVEDAGFADLEIIPMGADKVFLKSVSEKDTWSLLGEAKEFFDHFFANWKRWDKEVVPFKRGARLRLYGIPLHALNDNFFKLCVLDCGTFLRTDTVSLDRVRFDYARVLIATFS